MAVLLFFLCCLFCCAAAGPADIPAASAAIAVQAMYQAFFENARFFGQRPLFQLNLANRPTEIQKHQAQLSLSLSMPRPGASLPWRGP